MKRLALALILPVFLVGCGSSDPNDSYSPDNGEKSDIPEGGHYIKKVDVDGTTCVIYRDGSMGGVDCDYEGEYNVTQ